MVRRRVGAREQGGDRMDNEITALTAIFTEFYYWLTVVLMFLIHIGFCMYEVGASRQKNMMHTLMKNTMLIPLVTITFYFFGVVAAGFVLWGYPALPFYDVVITPWGQLIGAVTMFFVLGFIPAYVVSAILKSAGVLRIPKEIELVGLDITEYHGRYLDEAEIAKAELEEVESPTENKG